MSRGLIHLYTGDGKGKTTAALGVVVRASGQGFRVLLVQLLKSRDSGEVHALKNLPGVSVLRLKGDFGFFAHTDACDRDEMRRQNNENLENAAHIVTEGLVDLLVLDEICAAYSYGALDTKLADSLIYGKPPDLELVLTGRRAPEGFLRVADYVTEFTKIKHPYDRGVAARRGIEF